MIDKDKWEGVLKGYEGDPYRKHVMLPTILGLLPNIKGKRVLDLGTGNGIIIYNILKRRPACAVGVDISRQLLNIAKKRLPKDVRLYQKNIGRAFRLKERAFDIVICNLVLNELKELDVAARNIARPLKRGGGAVVGILHPSYVLGKFCMEGNKTLEGFRGYFGGGRFAEIYKDGRKSIKLRAYSHTISSYINELVDAGLCIEKMVEPKTPAAVIKENRYYKPYKDLPTTLYIVAKKG